MPANMPGSPSGCVASSGDSARIHVQRLMGMLLLTLLCTAPEAAAVDREIRETVMGYERRACGWGSPGSEGARRDPLATEHLRRGRHDDALDVCQSARRPSGAGTDDPRDADVVCTEGKVLLLLECPEEALRRFQHARSLSTGGRDGMGQAEAALGEAQALLALDRVDEARWDFQRARELFVAVGDRLGELIATLGEARACMLLGQSEDALAHSRRARELSVGLEDKGGEARALHLEATVLAGLDCDEDALHGYRRALRAYESAGDREGEATVLREEGYLLSSLERDEEALWSLQRSRALFFVLAKKKEEKEVASDEYLYAVLLGRFGELPPRPGDGPEQEADVETSAEALVAQALSLPEDGRCDDASAPLQQALKLFESEGSERDAYRVNVLLARCLGARGDVMGAVRAAERAVAIQQKVRRYGEGDWERNLALTNTGGDAFDVLIPLLAQRPEHALEALARAEQAHAPILLDLMGVPARVSTESDKEGSQGALRRYLKRLEFLERVGRRLKQRIRDITVASGKRSQTLSKVEMRLLSRFETFKLPPMTARPLSAQELHGLVQEVGPILLYYTTGTKVLGFLLLPGVKTPVIRVASVDKLWERVQRVRYDLANPFWQGRASEDAEALWGALIAPFEGLLSRHRRLVIVPHGALHQLPIESLMGPGDTPLFTRWDVSVVPSLSVLALLRTRGRAADCKAESFVAFAGGTGLHLPDVEVERIGTLFGTERAVFLQGRANAGLYRELTPRASHLLITTHGYHREHSPTDSYLELTATPTHDGRLRQTEIATLPLRCAELVTLSACDTARGDAMPSGERLDFVRAFLIAGARGVLATRWQVPEDRETVQFLVDFYEAYRRPDAAGRPRRKDEALTEARRKAMARGTPAQVWAAWSLVGDAR